MPGFDGTGPRGMGPMTGGGRGFCSPWGIGTASRPYGRFQGIRYVYPHYGTAPAVLGVTPLVSPMTREQELDFLRSQAEAMKEQLDQIDARITELETE